MTNSLHFLTMKDILDYKEPELVIIKDGEIVFVDQHYYIDIKRVRSRADIIEWIHHLTGKAWITNDMLSQFIEKVCSYRKFEIYQSRH